MPTFANFSYKTKMVRTNSSRHSSTVVYLTSLSCKAQTSCSPSWDLRILRYIMLFLTFLLLTENISHDHLLLPFILPSPKMNTLSVGRTVAQGCKKLERCKSTKLQYWIQHRCLEFLKPQQFSVGKNLCITKSI